MARNLDNILAGLYSKFTSDATTTGSLYDLVGGRYYLTVAPQDISEPYIVVKVISQVPDWCFGSTMELIRVQFSIFTTDIQDNTNVIAILDKLRDTYDWCSLTITGYSFVSMKRDVATGPLFDEGLYATQDYLIWVQES